MQRLVCIVALVLGAGASRASAEPSPAAEALSKRIVPERAAQFVAEIIPATGDPGAPDVFEIEGRDGKVVLRGNTPVSIAAALNWYLKYTCRCQVSWCGDNLELPDPLP